MTIELFVDNDVVIKCSCYRLLSHIKSAGGGTPSVGILGAARFVVMKYLARRGKIRDRVAAQAAFDNYLESALELEPTREELTTATGIEEEALKLGLDLDGGESQLCAMALHRGSALVLTGDKRAIMAIEQIRASRNALSALEGRIVCLEQAMSGIAERIGPAATRAAVCAEPDVDITISICFECTQPVTRPNFSPDGLKSYIGDLRSNAPMMLYPPMSL